MTYTVSSGTLNPSIPYRTTCLTENNRRLTVETGRARNGRSSSVKRGTHGKEDLGRSSVTNNDKLVHIRIEL